jgi:hypothetical protein
MKLLRYSASEECYGTVSCRQTPVRRTVTVEKAPGSEVETSSMLPDFPVAKEALLHMLQRFIDSEVAHAEPFLGKVPKYIRHEGKDAILRRADGSVERASLQESAAEMVLSREEMRTLGFDVLAGKLVKLAKDLAGQQAGFLFGKINEMAESAGNVTVARGGKFNKELFLEALQRLEIGFDPVTGEATGPAMVIPESREREFQDEISSWDDDPEFKRRFDEIIASKKEDWHAREADRKLVD